MITVIQFLLSLSLLVLLHEAGHFFFARLFKTKVEKFYLFFDFLFPFSNVLPFSLFRKKVGDTVYGIGWFPLGGYVKIAGMVDESMDTEQLKRPPEPWEFRAKPAWQRLLIMLGGIIVNVILAILIFAMVLFAWGEQKLLMADVNNRGGVLVVDSFAYDLGFRDHDKIISVNDEPVVYYNNLHEQILFANKVNINRDGRDTVLSIPENLIGQLVETKSKGFMFLYASPVFINDVIKDSTADRAGLQKGDMIVAINSQKIGHYRDVADILQENKSKEVNIEVMRDNVPESIQLTVPGSGKISVVTSFGSLETLENLGFYRLHTRQYGFFESFPAGVRMAGEKVASYVKQFTKIFNPRTEAYKGVGGFYSISKIFGNEWDWHRFWTITGYLSIVLAFMNLLPIPGLDGGYVMFNLWEMITGRKVSDRVMEYATGVGLVLLLLLMVYANANDVIRNLLNG